MSERASVLSHRFLKLGIFLLAVGLAVVAWVFLGPQFSGRNKLAGGLEEPVSRGGAAKVRRLSEAQYKRTIENIFGADIKVPGRFDPPVREDGLLAIGSSSATVTASGLEQNLARAEDIAKQVTSPELRSKYLKCNAEPATSFNDACASQFLNEYGRLLFSRPLTDDEKNVALAAAKEASNTLNDFYKGLQYGLMAELISPAFIYRVESSEPDPDNKGANRLDAYSLASRISFFLWDAPPDAELLDAAANGDLFRQDTLRLQVDRMVGSPHFIGGVRAFFGDMYGFEQFVSLGKDTVLYPRFSTQLRDDAEEQIMRTIIDLLVTQGGDYNKLFTTQTTFLNRNLASLFRLPVDTNSADGWVRYTFTEADHRAGLLTLPGFLMLDTSHEGRSSPTIRGKSIREFFLCQEVPPPPGNVNFDIVENTNSPLRTARERLVVHTKDPVCAGCHAVTDPVGLSFENYDPIGQFRSKENEVVIDASGSFDGIDFNDAIGLQRAMTESGNLASCVARRAYEYGVGRRIDSTEQKLMNYFNKAFAGNGYKFVDLMRLIATSKAFQSVTPNTSSAG